MVSPGTEAGARDVFIIGQLLHPGATTITFVFTFTTNVTTAVPDATLVLL